MQIGESMSDNDKPKFPDPDEIKREFEDFVRNKFGANVQVFAGPGPIPHGFQAQQGDVEPSDPIDHGTAEDPPVFEDLNFELKPKEVKEYLDRFVVKQEEAKKALAIAVCDHYRHIMECIEHPEIKDEAYAKQNILILGPTGVGKSYLIQKIAKLIGVPFVKADATRFSETGYMGANVDDLIKDLVSQADNDLERAQYGIIYLDEADKLASAGSVHGKDVNGRGVQFGLLKIMEESEVDLRSGHDIASQMQAFMDFQQKGKVEKQVINTRHILFIVSGAFTGLEDIIRERVSSSQYGFHGTKQSSHDVQQKSEFLKKVSTQDLITFGFEPEFVGRLPVRVNCEPLSAEDLYHVLTESEDTIIKQYKRSFKAYGIDVEFEESGLRRIAEMAVAEQTGARALMTVCESLLRDFKFELPSTIVRRLVIDRELVDHPQASLESLLANVAEDSAQLVVRKLIESFEKEYFQKHGMHIYFDDAACNLIYQKSINTDMDLMEYLTRLLDGFEHGLKLITQNTGNREFRLPPEILDDPQALLESWVKQSYQNKK